MSAVICGQALASTESATSGQSATFPKTHAGKESTLPMAVLTQELVLHADTAVGAACREMHAT